MRILYIDVFRMLAGGRLLIFVALFPVEYDEIC